MTEPIKSAYPVQTRILPPVNAGTTFTTRAYIQFRLNASELPMWLVNDSYLRFSIKWTRSTYTINAGATGNTNLAINNTYIRNAANIFDLVKVKYGGDDLYTQTFNIENNTIDMAREGESYLKKNYNTYTTNSSIKEGFAYLSIPNGTASNNSAGQISGESDTITDVTVPVNKLLPQFMDLNSVGFPIGKLKRQLEITLYIAEPYKFLVDYDDVMGDFSPYFRRCKSSNDTRQPVCDVPIETRFPSGSIEILDPELYCQCYVPTNEEDAVITSKINGSGIKYRFNLWHIGVREVKGIGLTNNIPFSVTSENTSALMLYCHYTKASPSLTYRPYVNSLYLRFGEMQLPFQPIAGDTYTMPFDYRFTSEDVLDNVDTHYSETNFDYNASYKFKARPTAITDATLKADTTPGSCFFMIGANFTNSPDKLGSPSSRWNHQYQASFNAPLVDSRDLRFVLGVKTEYGLLVKNGDLAVINI